MFRKNKNGGPTFITVVSPANILSLLGLTPPETRTKRALRRGKHLGALGALGLGAFSYCTGSEEETRSESIQEGALAAGIGAVGGAILGTLGSLGWELVRPKKRRLLGAILSR